MTIANDIPGSAFSRVPPAVLLAVAGFIISLPTPAVAESKSDDSGQTSTARQRVERPPIYKGDLGMEVGGGFTGLLAGPVAGGVAGGLVAWAGDVAVRSGNIQLGIHEARGVLIGASAGLLAGVPTGVFVGGNTTGGTGGAAATYLGSFAGLLTGGSLWGVTAVASRNPSIGFGIPATALGLISGGVIGYRLSASAPPDSNTQTRVTPIIIPNNNSGGWAGLQIVF